MDKSNRVEPAAITRRWDRGGLAGCGILAAGILAIYCGTLEAPFIFDDQDSIVANASLHHWRTALFPPPTAGVGGRPLLNLSFALNYALGGSSVLGYHWVNIGIHMLASCVLFGIVRRALRLPSLATRFGSQATALALCCSALWAWHPLQTASVTYLSERAESLMGLFYFATLYGFMRGATGEDRSRSRRWFCVAWLACLGGMATKEVMVTAPVVVFVFDAAILSGSLRSAWDRHRRVHLALAATWLPLAWLMAGIAQRGVGFSHGISAFDYASMECKVVVRYLLLTVWPHPLVLDHGVFQAGVGTTWPYALSIAAALAGLVVAWAWWPPLGFAAFWFFAILAPTSSVIPVAIQPMAENRLYLPLAAVAVGVVLLAFFAVRRWALIGAALIAAVLGVLAAIRNGDYASERSIWEDTVKKNPSNARAHNNLGFILSREGETAPAIAEFETALRLSPDDPRTHDNLGNAWVGLPGRLDDAIHEFQLALRADPDFAEAHNNLGNAWLKSPGHLPEAISEYEAALRLKPNDVEVSSNLAQARNNLGNALLETPGHTAEAIAQYEEALRLKPDYAVGHANLARALASQSGRLSEAVEQFKAALRLDPGDALVHDDLGNTLSRIQGRTEEAIAEYQTALRLQPRLAEAHNNLGSVLLALPGRRAEAVDEFRAALEIRPDFAEAHNNLGNALTGFSDQIEDAIAQFREAVRLRPRLVPARFNLAIALMHTAGGRAEAKTQLQEVMRLDPSNEAARQILQRFWGTTP